MRIGTARFGLALILCVACLAKTAGASAPAFASLYTFDSLSAGSAPQGPLLQGSDGSLYGTTNAGGDTTCEPPNGCGTIFKITPTGVLTTLHDLESTQGVNPTSGLTIGSDGTLYGTTSNYGDANGGGDGSIFSITPQSSFTQLYAFCPQQGSCDSDALPSALVLGADGNLYGTTRKGGNTTTPACAAGGCGTVFSLSPNGVFTTLYNFCAETNCADGSSPAGALVQGSDGNFYGVTSSGGNQNSGIVYCESGCGTVFKITPAGQLATLYSFNGAGDGATPQGRLLATSTGLLYGTNEYGGNLACAVNLGEGCGTIFEIDSHGVFTTLYTFSGADGAAPAAGVIEGTDGNFYGTTSHGGTCNVPDGCGTVYAVSPAGSLTTVHHFVGSDGSGPSSELMQASSGIIYGTTSSGGNPGCDGSTGPCGTIFTLSPATVATVATTTSLTIAPSSVTQGAGGGVLLSVNVQPASGGGTPTGTASFFNGTNQIGQPVSLSAGMASISYDTSSLAVGSYSISAKYSGDPNFSASKAAPALLIVSAGGGTGPGSTSTTLSINASPSASQADAGSSVTFTASVAHASGTAIPGGTVTFKSGSAVLATGTLEANGSAIATVNTLAAKQYSVTAIYSGDNNYQGSTSAASTLDVVDFQLAASPNDVMVAAAGAAGTATLTVTPLGGFDQTVSFGCSGLPSDAVCSFATTGNVTTLTISTAGSTAALSAPPGNEPAILFGWFLPAAPTALTIGRRRRIAKRASNLVLLMGLAILASGCGGGGGSGGGGVGVSGTPPGTSTVKVIASAGALSHQIDITLTVQ
jgi:uncharacterized repeat protein (TIGR03803 family)